MKPGHAPQAAVGQTGRPASSGSRSEAAGLLAPVKRGRQGSGVTSAVAAPLSVGLFLEDKYRAGYEPGPAQVRDGRDGSFAVPSSHVVCKALRCCIIAKAATSPRLPSRSHPPWEPDASAITQAQTPHA